MCKAMGRFGKALAFLAIAGLLVAPAAMAMGHGSTSADNIRNCPAENWCAYHRTTDKAWRHSPLDQITKDNVSQLKPAWIFLPGGGGTGSGNAGLHSTPLAIGGNVYLPGQSVHDLEDQRGNGSTHLGLRAGYGRGRCGALRVRSLARHFPLAMGASTWASPMAACWRLTRTPPRSSGIASWSIPRRTPLASAAPPPLSIPTCSLLARTAASIRLRAASSASTPKTAT